MNSKENNGGEHWVKQLHHRSWEMELLIVGFALLVLLRVPESLQIQLSIIESSVSNVFIRGLLPIGYTLKAGAYIMTFNLIVHLILRGYWIGIVGLNSAFPNGASVEKLNFQTRFTDYLRKKLQNLEDTAVRVDRICSVIFAFTFLLIFIFMSLALYFVSMVVLASPVAWLPESFQQNWGRAYVLVIFFSYVALGGILAVDFLSLGMLKRIKTGWFAKPYYILSQYFRLVTGFAFYQTIYYTLITNIPKKVIATILSIYVISAIGYVVVNYSERIFFPLPGQASAFQVSQYHYLDQIDSGDYIRFPVISTKINEKGYFELFIPYEISENDSLQKYCEEILPLRPDGLSWRVRVSVDTTQIIGGRAAGTPDNLAAILDCIRELYEVSIDDSILQNVDFLFYQHPHLNEPGYLAVIRTTGLKPGLHQLLIRKKFHYLTKREREANTFHIPFWVVRK